MLEAITLHGSIFWFVKIMELFELKPLGITDRYSLWYFFPLTKEHKAFIHKFCKWNYVE